MSKLSDTRPAPTPTSHDTQRRLKAAAAEKMHTTGIPFLKSNQEENMECRSCRIYTSTKPTTNIIGM
ncbi:MAG: hypothetical protein IJ528_02090 [Bacteroidaceae bacterium]|nr:hypothetical protein [Bacteroidaceae bacterium]